MNDRILDGIAKDYAEAIIEEISENGRDINDLAHEFADGSEHVIYYAKAHAICQNCNIDQGEEFVDDYGTPQDITYDGLAALIAYGELYNRILVEIDKIKLEEN